MADIINLGQVAQDTDYLRAAWINAVAQKIASLDEALALANQQVADLKSQLSTAFQVKPVAGLNLSVAAGSVKIGVLVVAIAASTITVPNNATSIIWISDLGTIVVSANRPTIGLEIARVVSANNAIISVQNYPLFEVRPAAINIDNYATIDYANSRSRVSVAVARKTALYAIPGNTAYYVVPFESLKGEGFATSGVFTAPVTGQYLFDVSARVDTLAPSSSALAVKLSLFSNSQEIAIIQQADSAYGDITLNGSNPEPLQMTQGQTATIQVYLTRGIQSRVRENYTAVQVWRLPA
jgi:hypothetical protein